MGKVNVKATVILAAELGQAIVSAKQELSGARQAEHATNPVPSHQNLMNTQHYRHSFIILAYK